jgi:hypothetical protein
MLDVITEFRVYFRESITDKVNYCLEVDSDEEKADRFEALQKEYVDYLVDKFNTTEYIDEDATISPEGREEYATIIVNKLFDKYYRDLKTYNIMVRRHNRENE